MTGVVILDPDADLTLTNFRLPIFLKADVDDVELLVLVSAAAATGVA